MSLFNNNIKNSEYDVIICGGGLAGQTLARQLRLNFKDLSIVVLEKSTFPFPCATHKVGESLVENSTFYLDKTLQLRNHLEKHQLKKCGLRFFWGPSNCFSERPEIGLSNFPPYDTFQIDRGIIENHLISLNENNNIHFFNDVIVQDVIFNENNQLHQLKYKQLQDQKFHTIKGRWIVDAMGRSRFLQKKLQLSIKPKESYSSSWFRIKGLLDVSNFVPQQKQDWHQKGNKCREYSTTHLIGHGYWIWIIQLSSGYTSIGIVTSEKIHRLSEYATLDRAMNWLQKHENTLHEHLQKYEVIDFLKVRNFSYTSKQIFSSQRWACTGDAAVFPDPFYAPGIVLMAYQNSIITKMIELDRDNNLTESEVKRFNHFILSNNNAIEHLIHSTYNYFDKNHIWSLRLLWEICLSWTIGSPQMFNSIYLCPHKSKAIQNLTYKFGWLVLKMEKLFKEWIDKTQYSFEFKFIDYLKIPFVRKIYERGNKTYENFDQILDNYREGLNQLEEFAHVIFLTAVKDTMPEQMEKFHQPIWLNMWSATLEPEKWEKWGLFRPQTPTRNFMEVYKQIENLYYYKLNAKVI